MAKRKNQLGIAPFDASEYLDNDELVADYLAAALEDPNPDVFLHAVADLAKARDFQGSERGGPWPREPLQGPRTGCEDPVRHGPETDGFPRRPADRDHRLSVAGAGRDK
jgi:hypothetical protein